VRRKLLRVAQWGFAIVVLAFISYGLARQWPHVHNRLATLDIHWGTISLASLLILGAYAVLIETWRRVLAAWDTELEWLDAARIWFASSLGKYIPGNIWSVAALGVMAKESGASSVAAAGSSIIVTILNLISGLAIVLVCGSRLVPHREIFVALAVASLGTAIAVPFLLPTLAAWLCRVTRRNIRLPQLPPATIWLSLGGTTLAWIAYGIAFRLFAQGMLGNAAGSPPVLLYVAVYTGAYILGFVTPVAPAGLGVREAGIVSGLVLFRLMGRDDAVIVALTSRLWLTILEVAPGLIALAANQTKTRTRQA
jgi:uncharacterized membrane protein YbhN (UPF0104 family)